MTEPTAQMVMRDGRRIVSAGKWMPKGGYFGRNVVLEDGTKTTQLADRARVTLSRLVPARVTPRRYAELRKLSLGTVKRWLTQANNPMPCERAPGGAVTIYTPHADAWLRAHLNRNGLGPKVCVARESVVYFIRAESTWCIKIGFTSNLKQRVRDLEKRFGSVEVLRTMPGTKRDELALHKRLAEWRVQGEWFQDCAEVRAAIPCVAQGSSEVAA